MRWFVVSSMGIPRAQLFFTWVFIFAYPSTRMDCIHHMKNVFVRRNKNILQDLQGQKKKSLNPKKDGRSTWSVQWTGGKCHCCTKKSEVSQCKQIVWSDKCCQSGKDCRLRNSVGDSRYVWTKRLLGITNNYGMRLRRTVVFHKFWGWG